MLENLIKIEKRITPNKCPGTNEPIYVTHASCSKQKWVDSKKSSDTVRRNIVNHIAEFDDRKYATGCKNKGSVRKTYIFCIKCDVHLWIVNCYDKKLFQEKPMYNVVKIFMVHLCGYNYFSPSSIVYNRLCHLWFIILILNATLY